MGADRGAHAYGTYGHGDQGDSSTTSILPSGQHRFGLDNDTTANLGPRAYGTYGNAAPAESFGAYALPTGQHHLGLDDGTGAEHEAHGTYDHGAQVESFGAYASPPGQHQFSDNNRDRGAHETYAAAAAAQVEFFGAYGQRQFSGDDGDRGAHETYGDTAQVESFRASALLPGQQQFGVDDGTGADYGAYGTYDHSTQVGSSSNHTQPPSGPTTSSSQMWTGPEHFPQHHTYPTSTFASQTSPSAYNRSASQAFAGPSQGSYMVASQVPDQYPSSMDISLQSPQPMARFQQGWKFQIPPPPGPFVSQAGGATPGPSTGSTSRPASAMPFDNASAVHYFPDRRVPRISRLSAGIRLRGHPYALQSSMAPASNAGIPGLPHLVPLRATFAPMPRANEHHRGVPVARRVMYSEAARNIVHDYRHGNGRQPTGMPPPAPAPAPALTTPAPALQAPVQQVLLPAVTDATGDVPSATLERIGRPALIHVSTRKNDVRKMIAEHGRRHLERFILFENAFPDPIMQDTALKNIISASCDLVDDDMAIVAIFGNDEALWKNVSILCSARSGEAHTNVCLPSFKTTSEIYEVGSRSRATAACST